MTIFLNNRLDTYKHYIKNSDYNIGDYIYFYKPQFDINICLKLTDKGILNKDNYLYRTMMLDFFREYSHKLASPDQIQEFKNQLTLNKVNELLNN